MVSKQGKQKNGPRQSGISPETIFKNPINALQTTLKDATDRLGVDRTTIWLFTRTQSEIHLAYGYDRRRGSVQPRFRVPERKLPVFHKTINENRPFWAEDINQSPPFAELADDYWTERKIKSALAIPVRKGDGLHRVIFFESQTTRIWTDDDIKNTSQLVTDVEHVLDTLEMRGERKMLAAIQDIQDYLVRGDLSISLERVIELGSEIVQADGGLAYLKISERDMLQCVVSHQTRSNWLGGVVLNGNSPAAVAVRRKQAGLLSEYPDWTGKDEMYTTENISSMLYLPVIWKDEIRGVLLFFRREKAQSLNQHDLEKLAPLALQAAVIMQVDRFQEEIRRQDVFRDVLKKIGEIGVVASSRSDLLTTSLELLCRELRSTSGVATVGDRFTTMGVAPGIGKAVIELIRESGLDLSIIQVIPDWENPQMNLAIKEDILRLGFKTTLIVPLHDGGQRHGFLTFAAHKPRTWLADEIAMVEIAGELLSASLERLEAAATIVDQTRALRMLETAGQGLNRKSDPGAALNRIGEGVMSLAKTYRAALLLMKNDGTVYIPWMSGLTRSYAEEVTTQDQAEFARLFGLPAEVVLTQDTTSKRDHALYSLLRGDQFHTISLWPMMYDEKTIAVMACYFDVPPLLRLMDHEMIKTFLRQSVMAIVDGRRIDALEQEYIQVASVLAKAVAEAQSESFEESHSSKIELARETARQLSVSEKEIDAIYWAALLHDIGKADVPKNLLNKPGKLNTQDWEALRQVPVRSEKYLGEISYLRDAALLARHVREHYDGDGYPDRLTGEEIPLGARILAVVDAYQAMKEKRAYHEARSHEEAVAELLKLSGKQFDPRVVQTFVQTAQKGSGSERTN